MRGETGPAMGETISRGRVGCSGGFRLVAAARGSTCLEFPSEKGELNWGYNAASDEYEDLVTAGVIDPTKVTRTALQNAASIAGLLLTTECVVVEHPEENEGGGGGGMPGGMGGMYCAAPHSSARRSSKGSAALPSPSRIMALGHDGAALRDGEVCKNGARASAVAGARRATAGGTPDPRAPS